MLNEGLPIGAADSYWPGPGVNEGGTKRCALGPKRPCLPKSPEDAVGFLDTSCFIVYAPGPGPWTNACQTTFGTQISIYRLCKKRNRSRTQTHDKNNTTLHTTRTAPHTTTQRTAPLT